VLGTVDEPGTEIPGCFLNERPTELGAENLDYTTNNAVRWMDPGTGGSRVTVVVTYHHPLVTPLALGEFVQISARRSAVVEDFQGAGAAAAFNPLDAGITGGSNEAIIPEEDTETPTTEAPADTATFTPVNTATFTPSPTPAPLAFDCSRVYLAEADFNENLSDVDQQIGFQPGRVVFRIRNENNTRAIVDDVLLSWGSADYISNGGDPVPNYPGFFFSEFLLDGDVMWQGPDYTPDSDTAGADGTKITNQVFNVPAEDTVTFAAVYQNGPTLLNSELPRGAFGGTRFTITDPINNVQCALESVTFDSTTNTIDVDPDATPTDEITDCASEFVGFEAASSNTFQDFGWVKFVITNNHPTAPAPLSDFSVTWGRLFDRNGAPVDVRLQGVYVGGETPPEGVQLWQSTDPLGAELGVIVQGNSPFDN
ncbi:MAG: hypothetical protein AAF125_24845, partial [Chloroflexota bacterium]